MKIGVGVNFFLEGNNLAKCLASLHKFDIVFCIDGRYPQFEADSDLSNDGSRATVQRYRNTILVNRGNTNQLDKRNEYLRLGREFRCDYILVCDADFTVAVDFRVLLAELRRIKNPFIHNVIIKESSYASRMGLLVNPEAVEYHAIHHIMRCRKCHFETDLINTERKALRGITITHHDKKSKVHRQGKKAYRKWKQPIENRLRRQRGMLEIYGQEA